MPFSTETKNAFLDSQTYDRVQLHSGDPGSAGTANALGTKLAATFNAASAGVKTLAADVAFTGLAANQSVTYFSAWDNNGGSPVFKGSGQITTGDTTANAAGAYTLKATTTLLEITDS